MGCRHRGGGSEVLGELRFFLKFPFTLVILVGEGGFTA